MSPFSPTMIILWIIIPAANFFTWYYVGQNSLQGSSCPTPISISNSLSTSTSGDTLSASAAVLCDNYDIEDEFTFTPAGNYEKSRGILGYKGCHPVIHPDHESPNLLLVGTESFDSYRTARLATMTLLKGNFLIMPTFKILLSSMNIIQQYIKFVMELVCDM